MEDAHELQTRLTERDAELSQLQQAVSDMQVYVFQERDQVLRLHAENDRLKVRPQRLSEPVGGRRQWWRFGDGDVECQGDLISLFPCSVVRSTSAYDVIIFLSGLTILLHSFLLCLSLPAHFFTSLYGC